MTFYSYFMDTAGPAQDYGFFQMVLRTTGTPGEFRICSDSAEWGNLPFVVHVNGTRSTGVLTNGSRCSWPFSVGAGGDFQVSIRRNQIFGVHSGDGNAAVSYNVFGISQF